MFLHKTPAFLAKLFPDILWRVATQKKEIFLTFDDGPVPEATTWVLDQLKQFGAKATFFMVGANINKYHEVYESVEDHGHTVGNHSYSHLNGWQTKTDTYLANINKAELMFDGSSKLYRPPHGRLKWDQYSAIKPDYKIIMWDVLSGDFRKSLANEDCLHKSIKSSSPGSIIVFHDSIKAINKLKYVLPRYLEYFSKLGYSFKPL